MARQKKTSVKTKDDSESKELAIATAVKKFDATQTLKRLDELCDHWRLSDTRGPFETQLICMFAAFDVDFGANLVREIDDDRGKFGLKTLNETIVVAELEAMSLFHRMRELQLVPTGKNDDNEKKQTNFKKIVKILEMIFYAKKVVLSSYQAKLAVHALSSEAGVMDLDVDLDTILGSWGLRFRFIDDRITPFQELLLFLLDSAMDKQYRKQDGFLYEPILIDSRSMHSYRQVYEIKDFVYSRLRKEISFSHWSNATQNAKNVSAAADYLTNCHDTQLPWLRKQRGVYSFPNGVYFAHEDLFHKFETEEKPLSDSIVACKFFEMDFDDTACDSWRDIQTPHIDGVMRHQQWTEDVQKWLFIMIGRMLYETGELDSWQVVPFFVGLAGTGKSLLVLKVIKLFFETCDVGILSNNIESKFGISALHDKMLVCAPEVRNDLKLDQAEFQSMVSGEEISVAVKHQNAFTIEWKVPMVMAGNEIPNWADASGSIQRRLVVFEFGVPVTAGDMKLSDKLYDELPRIIRKANKAYLEAVSKHASENIWKILPDYFAGTREAIARSTNFVENFLSSEHVIFGPDLVVPFADFKSALKDYAITNGLPTKSFTAETFHGPFARRNVKVLDQQSMEYNGRKMNTVFLKGIAFKPVEIDTEQCLL